jgi:hypothetical protein
MVRDALKARIRPINKKSIVSNRTIQRPTRDNFCADSNPYWVSTSFSKLVRRPQHAAFHGDRHAAPLLPRLYSPDTQSGAADWPIMHYYKGAISAACLPFGPCLTLKLTF